MATTPTCWAGEHLGMCLPVCKAERVCVCGGVYVMPSNCQYTNDTLKRHYFPHSTALLHEFVLDQPQS